MKINRVHLENYRIHENLDIRFTNGINLLLGKNGKGKSSILEAIGIALFDSKPRTTLEDAVTFGKKSGKIEIDFTGIDDEEYTVTKRIPGGGSKLCRISDNFVIDGKSEKIKELCGIKGEIKDIYDNVIVAKQNEFISAFKEKPATREKIFNKVFNTDIYSAIYDKNSLQALRRYESMLDVENTRIDSKESSLENLDKVKDDLANSKRNLENYKTEYVELERLSTGISKTKNLINNLHIQLEKINTRKRISENSIDNFNENEEKLKKLIIETENAQKIVEENKENFEKYKVLHSEVQKIKNEKKQVEILKNEYLLQEKNEIRNSKTISEAKGNLDLINNKKENINSIIKEKTELFKTLNEEIEEKKQLKENCENKLITLKPLINTSEEFEKNIDMILKESKDLKKDLENKKSEVEKLKADIETLKNEKIEEKLSVIKEYEEELQKLFNRNSILDTQNAENKEAYKILKSSECPYLREKCENLKGKNIEEFFNNKFHSIQKEKLENLDKIEVIKKKTEGKKELEEKSFTLTTLTNNLTKKYHEIETTALKLEFSVTKKEKSESKYENYKITNGFESIKELNEQEISVKLQLKNLNLEDSISNWKQTAKDIEKFETKLVTLSKSADENKRVIEKLALKNEEIKKYLKENIDIISKFEEIKNLLDEKEKKLEILEESKNIYIENYQKSLGKDSLIIKLERNTALLQIEKTNFSCIEKERSELEETLAQYNMDKIASEEKEINEKISINRENFGKMLSLVNTLDKKIEEIKKEEENIKILKKNVKKLQAKIKLTKTFRDNIKNMGREVAKNMLKEIEITATENFRKITGRGERIIWSNDDSDKYLVYLVNNDEHLKFEQLSGGEQVAVAISIRSAMSNLFTDSQFSIFDEPTNNLDSEKRQSLADSIGEILKDLEQSIIVTHDDTFREMAEKVIIL